MEFTGFARVWRKPPNSLSLPEVWNIAPAELSTNGSATIELLNDANFPLPKLLHDVAWSGQALLEFQDLQTVPLPREGRFFNLNYMFCEGLSVLREGVVCGLNGQMHSSLAALRSALELFSFHYWWKHRLFGLSSYEEFYGWLLGGRPGATFSSVIADLFKDMNLPSNSVGEKQFRDLYSKLCSYAHRPILKEAIASIRQGNQPAATPEVILYWLLLLQGMQRAVLEVAISQSPHALFPLPLERKFGFSPPVGVFFDGSNFLPLQQALGREVTRQYQAHYQDLDPPKTQLKWFDSLPDLTDDEILASWKSEGEIDDSSQAFEERVLRRVTMLKAKMRALMWGLSYGEDVPDVDELARRPREPS